METLQFEDCNILYNIVESKFMHMSVVSLQSSNNHAITIKISKIGIVDDLASIIYQCGTTNKFIHFIISLIVNMNKTYEDDILSITVDSEFLHIEQLSSNLMYSCKGV